MTPALDDSHSEKISIHAGAGLEHREREERR
jgi:hypothetical protein